LQASPRKIGARVTKRREKIPMTKAQVAPHFEKEKERERRLRLRILRIG
jgi:hypothetical protein